MAVSIVMTGAGRSCTLTSGSPSMVVSSATGLVVGATIQGTGIPSGTKIAAIAGTTITMSANATVTNSTASLIFSSVYGSIVTIQLTASGDTATWQNVFNAGFGLLQGSRELFFPGAMTLVFDTIAAGAVFNHQDWTVEYGTGGRQLFDSGKLAGEQRGGYLVNGTQFIKAAGPTFVFNNWNNSTPGGSGMFTNTGGLLTKGGLFRMHNPRFVLRSGSNNAFAFVSTRDDLLVENMILDYQYASGSNASIGGGYGTLKNTYVVFANSGIQRPNSTSAATIDGLFYVGLYGDSPNHKFAIPNNYILDGYAPQVLSTQLLGGFQDNTTETFSNINLSTAGWGLEDLKTKYRRFGGPNEIRFPRTVAFEFNDSSASNLTGVTLYISSGGNSVINEAQAGDYNAITQALVLNWTSSAASYRVANTITDRINQIAQIRKYGYQQQSVAYSLNLAPYSQPFFMLDDVSLYGIDEATAAAITTAGINWTAKTITPTADLTYDQINARIAWELAQTTGSANADPRTIVGPNLTLATGWTLVVNTGRTISAGTNLTYLYVPTVTLNGTGKITAVYATTAGTSTIWEFQELALGNDSACAVWDSSGNTLLYVRNPASATQRLYLPPGSTLGTLTYGVAKYGKRFEYGTFPANAGGVLFYVPDYQDDVGITGPALATVEAYTAIDTSSKFYDRAGAFKLTEQGIKLGDIAVRSGTAIETGSYSILVKQNASSVFGVVGSLITIKSTSFAGDSKYLSIIATAPATVTGDTNEVITIDIEDANGNSSVTLNGGDGTFELWKISASTATNDYATGTLLDTVGNEKFRFIGIAGFDMVGVDINSNIRRRISMAKGVYTMAFYVGDQIQLAQAPQVIENGIKLDVLQVDLDALITDVEAIKGAGFASTDSLVAINSNVKALPLLSEIEASTLLAKESSITALGSPLQADDYLAPDNAKIATIDTNVASIGVLVADLPLLSEIEASTVLAKESSITALGAPLQADDYVAPDNATIAEIKTQVDTLQNVDLSNVPADVWAYAVRTLTTAAGLTEAQVALLEGIKTQTDLLPAQPAGVGDAMTLTTAYDASKTAASQSSVNALGAPLQAGDYVEPDNAGIAVLVTDVGNVPSAVRQELATELARIDVDISTRSDLTVEDIPEGLTVAEIEASTVLAKEKSVQNTMAIAASRIAF